MTSVDRAAEAMLMVRLRGVLPRAVVVGEEATAADPSLLAAVGREPLVWLIDPIDGTTNYVNGCASFAVMVALVRDGERVASWINQPVLGGRYTAERGSGAW